MVRIYLNKTTEILNKHNIPHHEYNFIRQRVCWQVYDLMSELCCETNVGFFNELFNKIC